MLLEEGTRIAREDGGRWGIIIIGGRDMYCMGGVRRLCYDIHILASLQMIKNEYACVCTL